MKKWAKSFLLAASLSAMVAAPLLEASAGRRHRGHGYHGSHHRHHYYHRHRSHRSDAVAAGIIGLGLGAIIGSALSQPSQPRVIYRDPPRPARGGYAPWSPGWHNYCTRKYRSFNPNTGTFRGYDGRDHFCNAP